MKRAIIALLIIAAIGVGVGAYYIKSRNVDLTVNTSPITRGDVVDAVASTGILQPVISVTVGSQVSGNIAWLGADFNSIVKKNQVIAKLDPTLFEAAVAQATASLANAKAALGKDQVNQAFQKLTYQRNVDLRQRGIISQNDFDASKTAADQANAQVDLDKAQIAQATAQLSQAKTNLEHTIITSPIDGIVTQRSVDVGQTVAASMTAPQLFIIAADLTKMQVSASIDESDVGRVRPGLQVTFHVDAYPGEEFHGTVSQVRLNPVVVNNVTTYATMIDVPNPSFRLKPGMTANLKVQVAKRTDTLRVPNAALRFRPTVDMFQALNQAVPPELTASRGNRGARGQGAGGGRGPGGGNFSANAPGGRGAAAGGQGASASAQQGAGGDASAGSGRNPFTGGGRSRKPAQPNADDPASAAIFQPRYGAPQSAETINTLFPAIPTQEARGRVWVFVDHQLKPLSIRTGITDGTYTELVTDEVPENTEVVTSVSGGGSTRNVGGAAGGNPLMPNQRGGGPGGFGGGPGRGR